MTDLDALHRRIKGSTYMVVDVETDGLDWKKNKTVGYVLSFGPLDADGVYLPIRHEAGGNLDEKNVLGMLRDALPAVPVVIGHNLQFDLQFIEADGIRILNPKTRFEDTQINACLIDELSASFSLDAQAKKFGVQVKRGDTLYEHMAKIFGGEPVRSQMANFWKLRGDDPYAVSYAVGDGASTWQLWAKQQSFLDEKDGQGYDLRQVWDVECRLIPILAAMSKKGVRVDEDRLVQVRRLVERKLQSARAGLPEGFNERSGPAVRKYMEAQGLDDFPRTEKGNPSFPESYMLTNEPGRRVIAVRKMSNLLNSFVIPLQERHLHKGRVHTTFNQARSDEFGTITGRLSSSDPNLQQVPKRNKELGPIFRSVFVPDEGMIWGSADLSQCEPRILAHYSECKVLLDGYRAKPSVDAHSAVAKAANVERQKGKTVNQLLLTGGGTGRLSEELGISLSEAQALMKQYFDAMPEIKKLQDVSKRVFEARGYVRSFLGRRAHLEDRRFSYKAINRLLQCGNADMIKWMMVRIGEETWGQQGFDMLLNIHDALDFQFSPDAEPVYRRALEIMCDVEGPPFNLIVPMETDADEGKNWGEATYGMESLQKAFAAYGEEYV
jgi:DNA polymerase-1